MLWRMAWLALLYVAAALLLLYILTVDSFAVRAGGLVGFVLLGCHAIEVEAGLDARLRQQRGRNRP